MKIFKSTDLQHLRGRDQLFAYNGMDTMVTHELHNKLGSKLDHVTEVTSGFMHDLLSPALLMMRRGLKVDLAERDRRVEEIKVKIAKYTMYLDILANAVWDKEINHRSGPQLKSFFYDHLSVPRQISVAKGEVKVAVDREALEKLSKGHVRAAPFARLIMALRDLEKERDVLTKGLTEDGRFLYGFNVAGTTSGRYSSKEHPYRLGSNIQNIDPALRSIFIPEPGHVFISCDLQGAEARVVAYLCGDEKYIEVVDTGDSHTVVASMVWGFKPDRKEAEKEFYRGFSFRDMSKKFQHGSNYNGKARTLATQAHAPVHLVELFQRKYFGLFPGIRRWQEWVAREVQSKKHLVTPLGRRRYFHGRVWSDDVVREAISFAPQSVVGDLIHVGELNILRNLEPLGVQLLVNGHDSLLMQVPEGELDKLVPLVLEAMTIPVQVTDINGKTRTMTIPVDCKWGYNWGDQKWIEKTKTLQNPQGLRTWKRGGL